MAASHKLKHTAARSEVETQHRFYIYEWNKKPWSKNQPNVHTPTNRQNWLQQLVPEVVNKLLPAATYTVLAACTSLRYSDKTEARGEGGGGGGGVGAQCQVRTKDAMWGPSCTSCVDSELLPRDSLLPFGQLSHVAHRLQDWEPPAGNTKAVGATTIRRTLAASC